MTAPRREDRGGKARAAAQAQESKKKQSQGLGLVPQAGPALEERREQLVHPFPFLALPRHVSAPPSQNKSDLQWLLEGAELSQCDVTLSVVLMAPVWRRDPHSPAPLRLLTALLRIDYPPQRQAGHSGSGSPKGTEAGKGYQLSHKASEQLFGLECLEYAVCLLEMVVPPEDVESDVI
ncbi:hypothetical protein AAFF_G00264360 [Aldrovandia affinis]|uniref:Uncharacterized protein n=1 Tax=Aldrovandia affinis TaxID=143900 RepID=A0AAD7WT96_9TELE|nr:hypothetical protein AAFF_G00264360 [Aldrovandia affinis]